MHSFVRFLSRFVLFASTLRLILGSSLSEAAEPAADKPSVLLLGITRGSSDEQATAAPEIASAVAARLQNLGFSVVEMGSPGPRSAAPQAACAKGECLPARAQIAGTDLAMIGSVLRLPDLCSADLWLYDRHSGSSRRAEIQCQPKTPDSLLSDEFADQAGQLTEPPPAPLLAVPNPRVEPLSKCAPPATPTNRERPYWTRGRVIAAETLAVASTALLASTIVLVSIDFSGFKFSTGDPSDLGISPRDVAIGLGVSAGIAVTGLSMSLLVNRKRK